MSNVSATSSAAVSSRLRGLWLEGREPCDGFVVWPADDG